MGHTWDNTTRPDAAGGPLLALMPYNGPTFILLTPLEERHDQQAGYDHHPERGAHREDREAAPGSARPRLLVAFGVDHAGVIGRRGYSIEEQGKPPDFVLEVASVTTGQNDYTQKRDDYAAFRVPEYWRFDPSGGEYHDAPLAGDHLVDAVYQPIEVVQFGESSYRGHSAVLGLDLCWEDGHLRWYDPASGRYLLTYDEEAEGRLAEAERRLAAGEKGTPPWNE